MCLKKEIEPIQLGAFILLLRVKGEDEIAGFSDASQQFINAPNLVPNID
jgi:anthranilate phosphoribosyltransferase